MLVCYYYCYYYYDQHQCHSTDGRMPGPGAELSGSVYGCCSAIHACRVGVGSLCPTQLWAVCPCSWGGNKALHIQSPIFNSAPHVSAEWPVEGTRFSHPCSGDLGIFTRLSCNGAQ